MTHNHSPNTATNAPAEQAPEAAHSLESMSKDEVRALAAFHRNDLMSASEALTGFETQWTQENSAIEGSHAYAELLDNFERNGEIHSDDEKLAIMYMDTAIVKTEARSLVNETKVQKKYKHLTQDTIEALGLELHDEAKDKQKHNKKMAKKIQSGRDTDGSVLKPEDIETLTYNTIDNRKVANDALVAADELKNPTNPNLAETFINEIVARQNGDTPTLTDDELTDVRIDIHKKMRRNIRTARAYARLAKEFPSKRRPYNRSTLLNKADDLWQDNPLATRYAYGITSAENVPESFDDDLDDDDLAAKVAANTAAAAPASTPNQMPGATNQNAQNGQPAATQGNQQPGTNPNAANAPINPGAPANPNTQPGNAGNQGGNQPPAGTGTGNGGNTPPPANPNGTPGANAGGNAQPAPSTAASTSRALEGQKKLVNNARERLANSGRNRSRFMPTLDNVKHLHQDFGEKAYELFKMENPELLVREPGMTDEQWGSELASHATKQYEEVLKESTASLFKEEKKDSKKMKYAKVAARLGVIGVAGFIGGPAGAASAAAIMTGLKVGKKYEKNGREHLTMAIKEHQSERAVLDYIEKNQRLGRAFDPKKAFEVAQKSLQGQFEKGYVQKRRNRIKGAVGIGAATGVASTVLYGQAFDMIPWAGDQLYRGVAWLSWDGQLNPNFNYTTHDRPFSLSALSDSFNYGKKNLF